jgi:hypothetical protein
MIRSSASQISTFRDCQRKWALKHLAKLETPQNPYAALGSYIHERLEEYLTEGKLPTSSSALALELVTPKGLKVYSHAEILDIMLPGLVHLPAPGVADVERGFTLDLGDRGDLVGYIDFLVHTDHLRVGDHKTTSNMNFALTDETIRADVQNTIYAVAALELYPDFAEVDSTWVYYSTNPRRPKSTIAKCTSDEKTLAAPWEGVLHTIDEMNAVAESGTDPKEVAATITACDKYGGCPFRGDPCKLSASERMKGMRMQQTLKMKAAGAEQAVNPPEGAQATQPTVAQAVAAAKPMSALDRLKARKAAEAQAAAPVQAAVQAPVEVPVAVQATLESRVFPQVAPAPQSLVDSATQPTPPPVEPKPEPPPTPTVKRGRPAKAKTKVEPTIADVAAQPKGFTLYVNCSPTGDEPVQYFHDIAAQAIERIRVSHGAHYRLVEGLFGGAPALLSEAVGNLIEDQYYDIVLDLSTQEAKDAYLVLASKASRIVRGF